MHRHLGHTSSPLLLALCLLPWACGDDGGAEGDTTSGMTQGDGTTSASDTTSPGTTATTGEPDPTTTESADTVADDTSSSGGTSSDGTSSGDTTDGSSTGEPACEPGDDPLTLIWGRREGSDTRMVKVDLATATILAEYEAADSSGLRDISVSLGGRVATIDGNRTVQITLAHDCPVGSTSSGPDDVLPLGEDACVLAHVELVGPGTSSQNVAWAPPTWNETECAWQDEALWVRATNDVFLLDRDGIELAAVDLEPYWETGVLADSLGVDGDGNLWVVKHGDYEVAFVERASLAVTVHPVESPGWGAMPLVDAMGRPFFQSFPFLTTLDAATQTWQNFVGVPGRCGIDHGVMWCTSDVEILRFDLSTLSVDATGTLSFGDLGPHPGQYFRAVEADGEGHLWIEHDYFGVDPHLVRYDMATADVVPVEGVLLVAPGSAEIAYGDPTGHRLRVAMGR